MRKKDTTTTTWTRAGKGGGRLWESLGWDGMGLHGTDKGSRGKHHHHDSACIGIFGGYTPQRIFSLCVCVCKEAASGTDRQGLGERVHQQEG